MGLIFKKISVYLALVLFAGLAACGGAHESKLKQLRVGTIAGPESELMQIAKEYAKSHFDLDISVVEFNDYNTPNIALNDGSIDANMFQHQPFLDATIQAHGYRLMTVGKTFVYPMGLYSEKIKTLAEIPEGASVAIPNDPTNEARALWLLQKAGLIKLVGGNLMQVTLHHIVENPKKLKIQELDAAQIPRVLSDVYLAAINTNYAIPAGLLPSKDALTLEDKNSPYANIVVVKEDHKNDPRIDQLIESLHAAPVKTAASRIFYGQAIQAW